jgi:RNA polymerase sigma factor (sigma-70 family)
MEVRPFVWPEEAPAARFRFYVWRLIRYGVVSHYLRKKGGQPRQVSGDPRPDQAEEGADPIDRVAWDSDTPDRVARRRERRRLLPVALERAIKACLTEQQAEALRLRCVERLPAAEAAARLGVTTDQVRQWCHRALGRLREELRGQTSLFFSTR